GALADEADGKIAHAPALADAGVEHRRLPARVAADDQQRVGLVDPGDGGIEEIARPALLGVERRAILPAVEIADAEPGHQVLEREDPLARGETADNGADPLGVGPLELGRDDIEGIPPRRSMELAVRANIGLVEALDAQSVDDVAGLVGNPFLV